MLDGRLILITPGFHVWVRSELGGEVNKSKMNSGENEVPTPAGIQPRSGGM